MKKFNYPTSIRLPEELLEYIDQLAYAEHRSRSKQIEHLISIGLTAMQEDQATDPDYKSYKENDKTDL